MSTAKGLLKITSIERSVEKSTFFRGFPTQNDSVMMTPVFDDDLPEHSMAQKNYSGCASVPVGVGYATNMV